MPKTSAYAAHAAKSPLAPFSFDRRDPREFDVVIDIFTQFSSPPERAKKWQGIHQTLKPGGLVIVTITSPPGFSV